MCHELTETSGSFFDNSKYPNLDVIDAILMSIAVPFLYTLESMKVKYMLMEDCFVITY